MLRLPIFFGPSITDILIISITINVLFYSFIPLYRWDENTIYFFVPNGYYIFDINEARVKPSYIQRMSTFGGIHSRVTVTAAAKAFYDGIMYLFDGEVSILLTK